MTHLFVRMLATGFLGLLLPLAAVAQDTASSGAPAAKRAVLITGASSGIGRVTTGFLAANGWFVYAGARKAADIEELNAIDNVEALRLDVNKPDEVAAAVAHVRAAGRGLHGLVNNAGVLVVGPAIELDESELDYQFGANVYGVYRMTRAFAPLLIESRGRIVNISSISGILSAPLLSHYSMSKHAVEAYSDSLAAELARFGVGVSIIEPGNFDSDIATTLVRRMEREGTRLEDSKYAAEMQRFIDTGGDRSRHQPPHEVAEAIAHALGSGTPRRRYLVVPNQREADITLRKQIEELVQLNQGHPYSHDRDGLVKMLDEALAKP